MEEGHRGVGGSEINLLPNLKIGCDGSTRIANISTFTLNVDNGVLFTYQGFNRGEGTSNINYADIYAGLLARLKQDLFSLRVPTLHLNIEEENNYSDISR